MEMTFNWLKIVVYVRKNVEFCIPHTVRRALAFHCVAARPYDIRVKTKQTLYYIGGLLLVAGAVLPLFVPEVAPYVFAVGALLFAPVQMADRYEGRNLVIRRLRRQQVMGAFLLLVTAVLMFMQVYQLRPFRGGEWKIFLTIAVFLELYTVFRIDFEEKKEKK